MPISAVADIPADENVRGYLREAEGKERRMMTQVHRAILNTLTEHPSMFSVLNGGLVIVAKECELDDKNRQIRLRSASIINGSQTQGVIRDFLQKGGDNNDVHVKFELIITSNDDLVAEISIARTFKTTLREFQSLGGEANSMSLSAG